MSNPWHDQVEALGAFIRTQRKLANLSLRELASLTDLSNAYLSQIERGLHEPSVRVLRSIAQAATASTTACWLCRTVVRICSCDAFAASVSVVDMVAPFGSVTLISIVRT